MLEAPTWMSAVWMEHPMQDPRVLTGTVQARLVTCSLALPLLGLTAFLLLAGGCGDSDEEDAY